MKSIETARAWIELSKEALIQNVKEIRKVLPEKTEIIAVIKDNAYGHGDYLMAKKLQQQGISHFAVASLEEALRLRRKGINKEILILGRTAESGFHILEKENLIQSVVDIEYAEALNRYHHHLRVHLAIDTGLHRLGIQWDNENELMRLAKMQNLIVEGTYSHLACAESRNNDDELFVLKQKERFDEAVNRLKQLGIHPGKTHLQNTYGLLNYPEWEYDFVRIGIALTGVLNHHESTRRQLNLKPILRLYARVISIREIERSEYVGYGRKYFADAKKTIATVSIGYGDGIAKEAAKLSVLINHQIAYQAGRMCMDQCMIDVTGLNVKSGDLVLIAEGDKNSPVSIQKLAKEGGVLEQFIRLNPYLPRFFRE